MGKQAKSGGKRKGDRGNKQEVAAGAGAQRPRPPIPRVSKKEDVAIVPLQGMDIFVVDGALTINESRNFIEFAEALHFEHQGSLGAAHGEAFRDNDRTAILDPFLANLLWEQTGLKDIFCNMKIKGKTATGLNPNLRFYRYEKGQKFGRHIDESVDLGGSESTLYTLLIYLSGAFPPSSFCSSVKRMKGEQKLVGGETVFYGHKNRVVASVSPTIGQALLHIHGDDCNEHEAMEVHQGLKYVLRSDVVFQKN